MGKQLTCPEGHHWDAPPDSGSAAALSSPVCPVCGKQAETVRLGNTSLSHAPDLSAAVERAVAAFEKALRAGQRPRPEDHLPDRPTARPRALLELIHTELEYRFKAGERNLAEDYLARYPDVAADRAAAIGLILAEHQLQRRREPDSPPDELLRRFPAYRNELVMCLGASEGPSVPGYEVLGELGRGGMGVVYKARQVALKRFVALKMLRGGAAAGTEELARFRTEAEAVARLQHPNIVQVFEVGDHNGCPFFSLEYVAGGSLAAKLGGQPQPPRYAAAVVQALARAVHAAHEAGIVHRDLKPANVLLTAQGTPKVTDFGLAKRLDDESGQTRTGAVLGTPSYMAPEQADGRVKDIGPVTDVWALGAILYEMLAGRPPFRGATVLETLEQVRGREPDPLRKARPDVPLDLETICLKCLAKERERRYGSALELADELRRFLGGEPVVARPPGRLERAGRWAWRRRHALLAAAAALVVAVGTAVATWRLRPPQVVEKAVPVEPEGPAVYRGMPGLVFAVAFAPDGKTVLAGGGEFTAAGAKPGGDFGARQWDLATGAERQRFIGHTHFVTCAAFGPDGSERVVTGSADGTLRVWNARTGKETLCREAPCNPSMGAAVTPDATRALCANGNELVLWNLDDGRAVSVLRASRPLLHAVLSPDATTFVAGSAAANAADREGNRVLLWLPGDARPRQLTDHTGPVLRTALAPGGGLVASAGLDGVLRLWEPATGKSRVLGDEKRIAISLAFTPDGRRLLSGGATGDVRLWDVASGKQLCEFNGHHNSVTSMAFDRNGTRVVTGSQDTTVRVWDVASGRELVRFGDPNNLGRDLELFKQPAPGEVDPAPPKTDEREVWCFRDHQNYVYSVAFAPDGERALTAGGGTHENGAFEPGVDQAIRLWDLRTGKVLRRFEAHTHAVLATAFAPTKEEFASCGWDAVVLLWDSKTGKELGRSTIRDRKGTCLAYSPDGRWLVCGYTDRQVRLFDTSKQPWELVRRFDLHRTQVDCLAFAPDGRTVASGSTDGLVCLWEQPRGNVRGWLKGHTGGVRSVLFTPDGKRIVTAGADGTLRIWNAATFAEQRQITIGPGLSSVAAVYANGTRAVTGSKDGVGRVWDLETGKQLLRLTGHDAMISSVAVSADGKRALSGSFDGTVRVWQLDDALEQLKRRLGQTATQLVGRLQPRLELAEVLAYVATKVGLTIQIDEDRFQQAGIENVGQRAVDPSQLKTSTVRDLLDSLTDQVGARIVLRGDRVRVIPKGPEPPPI